MRPAFVHRIESRVTIRLQRARELAQVRFADARPCDPANRRTTPPPVCRLPPADRLAHTSRAVRFLFFHFPAPAPEPACRRRAASRAQHVTPQRFHQRRKQLAGAAHPVRQRRAFQLHAFALVNFRLAIQRQVIAIFRDQHMRQKSRSRNAALDRAARRFGACTMRSQHAQASFGRTCRITLNRAGTYSSISETSSPRNFSSPPQSGQAFLLRRYFALHAAGALAAASHAVSPPLARRDPCRCAATMCSPLVSPAALPAAVPVARSDDPAFPMSARTACAAAWRSAASSARSRCHATTTVHAASGQLISAFSALGSSDSRSGRVCEERQPLHANIATFVYSKIKMHRKTK
jgi:hypothetical protein